nr:immunoglobulin light chain junction region [Macaca mulatta]MOW57790.1 immunoglobulin light chain junction region [Macaca mulatta]
DYFCAAWDDSLFAVLF